MIFILITEFLVSTLIVPQGKCLTCSHPSPSQSPWIPFNFFFLVCSQPTQCDFDPNS